jgi:hypothetical protein
MTLAHMRPGLSDARQLLSNLFNNRSDDFFESAEKSSITFREPKACPESTEGRTEDRVRDFSVHAEF